MSVRASRLVAVAVTALGWAAGASVSAQQGPSYPWLMPATGIASFSSLTYKSGDIAVTFGEGTLGPITIKAPGPDGQLAEQVTGLEVLGAGKAKVQRGEEVLFEDDIHGAMFRFHPDDQQAFVTVADALHCPDLGVREMLLHLCSGSFARFWHRGNQAFIPDRSVGAAFVYSRQKGGVMIWQNQQELGAYCMTSQSELFKR